MWVRLWQRRRVGGKDVKKQGGRGNRGGRGVENRKSEEKKGDNAETRSAQRLAEKKKALPQRTQRGCRGRGEEASHGSWEEWFGP